MFDPDGDYLKSRLQGYRLVNSQYEPLLPIEDRIRSEQLNLDLVFNGGQLRFYDPVRNRTLESYAEAMYRIQQAAKLADEESERINQEVRARAAVEAELAHMRAALEALQKSTQETTSLRSTGDTPQDEQE